MWYVPHHSFFYWLCACTLYLTAILNLTNLNIIFGHNLLISYLHYYRSWSKYDKHSQSKMNIWKTLNVILHEITFYITNFLFMCAWILDTRLGTFVIEKKSKIHYGLLLVLTEILGMGFMNMYIQCMWYSLKLLICLENSNSNAVSFNFYTMNVQIYGTRNSWKKTKIHKKWCVWLWSLVDSTSKWIPIHCRWKWSSHSQFYPMGAKGSCERKWISTNFQCCKP